MHFCKNPAPSRRLQLTSGLNARRQIRTAVLIRLAACAGLLASTGCSTYLAATEAIDQTFEQPSKKPPTVDLSNAKWQKFAPGQPNDNALRIAIIARETSIGATRIAIKLPPDTKIPPHWFAVQGTYTVLSGVLAFEGVDADGKPLKSLRQAGDFATIPANLILRISNPATSEAVLYLTLYGADWSPQMNPNAWGKPVLRGAR